MKVGYTQKLIESKETFSHVSFLAEYGQVLWGVWKSETSKASFSKKVIKEVNENHNRDGVYFYLRGKDRVLKIKVREILFTDEVKEKKLEKLIPSYYSIDTPVYCWYLVDEVTVYGNKDCLKNLYTSNGKELYSVVGQSNPASPWEIFNEKNF